jgi:hypothetical protein
MAISHAAPDAEKGTSRYISIIVIEMKEKNVKRIITSDSNKFFEIAIASSEMKSITGGTSEMLLDMDSCGCHGCANLCCSGFNPNCSNLA